MKSRTPLTGSFDLYYRDPRGRKYDWGYYVPNGVTVEGVNYVLDWAFRGGVQQPDWYMGVIDNAGFSGLSSSDTHASHPGWGEYVSLYNSDRPAWVPSASAGGVMTNPSPGLFEFTSGGTIRGAILASRQAVGLGSGAVLYATAAMSAGMSVSAGGTLQVTYTGRIRGA